MTVPIEDADAIPTRILIMGMAHEDGSVHAAEVYPVAEACGVSDDSVRSCLRRFVADDLYKRDGEGREAIFRPTTAGQDALDAYIERTRLAYVQDAAGRGWDRHWRLVAFAVPESRRSARDQLRDRLVMLGGAALQNGVYVSPHPWFDHVRPEAKRLGLLPYVTLASTDDLESRGTTDPRKIAAVLWPLDDIADRYRQFLAAYQRVPEALAEMRTRKERMAETDYLAGSLSMVMAFRRCFDRDPLLPPELLPRPWPGRSARELVAASYRLAMLSRADHTRPALFRHYADIASAAGL